MEKTNYHNMMIEHLTCERYRVINKDPGNKIMVAVTKAIKISSLDDSIKNKFTPKNSIMPRKYGAAKIHKHGAPL